MITTNNTNNNTNTTTGGLLEVVSCLPAGRGASSAPENSTLNKETREIRVFLIYSYFSLKILSDVFD